MDEQDFRREHERASEREHLLFPTAHAPGQLRSPFGEAGKSFETYIEVAAELSPRGAAECSEQQILFDREFRKQSASLGHKSNSEIDDFFRAARGEIVMSTINLRDD